MGLDPAPACPIRTATADDYREIVEVWLAAGLEIHRQGRESETAFRRQVGMAPSLTLVATDHDRVVGVVLGSHDGRKGWINRLAVRPDARRRGIGAALVEACDAAIRAEGIGIVAALVEPDNTASRALFERLGYVTDVPAVYYRKLSHPGI